MSSYDQPCVLITIPISHFCEKARWALDRAGVRYRERAHLQLIHWLAVRRAGGGTTVPVLVCGDRVLADSALQRDFDTNLGPHGRRWMYNELRGRRDLAIAYGCTGVPTWERRALALAYPAMARVIDRFLDITAATAAQSEAQVRRVFHTVAMRLSDNRPYLCGERFTAADLTFAALAASVLMPPGYGVPLPQPEELPAATAAVVREFRAHTAGAHALAMFRDERR
jgi:glutathione S-transferase